MKEGNLQSSSHYGEGAALLPFRGNEESLLNRPLMDTAKKAIEAVYCDPDTAPSDTRASLKFLKAEIESYLDTLHDEG